MHRRAYERSWRNATQSGRAVKRRPKKRNPVHSAKKISAPDVRRALLGSGFWRSVHISCVPIVFASPRRRFLLATRMVDYPDLGGMVGVDCWTPHRNPVLARANVLRRSATQFCSRPDFCGMDICASKHCSPRERRRSGALGTRRGCESDHVIAPTPNACVNREQ
jgi:hypothetical protein